MPGQPAHQEVVQEFGPEALQPDGQLDRKGLGAIVFADPQRRKRLEAITHPAIRRRQERILRALEEEAFEGLVIWDAALLLEGGGQRSMDRVVVVAADPDTELRRLMGRDGLAEADALQRIRSQMPVADKVKLADHVVDNSGSRAETERRVREVHGALVAELRQRLAGAPR